MSDPPQLSSSPTGRLVSLDAFRGFTMLAMASGGLGLVHVARQYPESSFWKQIAYHAEHVEWVGCAAWDLIQPAFMFMVGTSMAFSYAARQAKGQSYRQMCGHAVYRALILVLLGVFLRSNGREETYWTFEDVVSQIGLGYIPLFLLWGRGTRIQLAALAGLLVGYWLLFAAWPLPTASFDYAANGADPQWPQNLDGFAAHWNKNTNPAHFFDLWWLNLFPRSEPFLFHSGGYHTLSFVPSLATMLMGLLAGEWLRSPRNGGRKFAGLVLAGVACLAAGWAVGALGLCPVVKRIWTPSWVLFSGGWTLLLLALFFGLIDVLGWRRWAFPAVVVGMNSIAIYMMTWLTAGWIVQTMRTHFGQQIFATWGDGYDSLLRKSATLLVLWLICFWMYRRKIFLRI